MNDYKEYLNIINNIGDNKKLLLHSCCAPCSSAVIMELTNYFDITVIYYNPNIEPYNEYLKRKEEQIRLIQEIKSINKLDYIDCDYDNNIYKDLVKGYENEPERGSRCSICFDLRLRYTAIKAKDNNYDYFGTTLTLSPYKNSKVINEVGNKIANEIGIKYLVSDFKKNNGYLNSIKLSKEYNLYRQNYCGCIYSQTKKIED